MANRKITKLSRLSGAPAASPSGITTPVVGKTPKDSKGSASTGLALASTKAADAAKPFSDGKHSGTPVTTPPPAPTGGAVGAGAPGGSHTPAHRKELLLKSLKKLRGKGGS